MSATVAARQMAGPVRESPLRDCPVCGSPWAVDVIDIQHVPIHCNLLWPTREQALTAPTADIRLAFCGVCGHTANRAFNPDLMAYTQRYENSLHFSPKFQEYARSVAMHLLARYDLHGKDIIEIGCGKGEFLSLLALLGEARCLGFDPSYVPEQTRTGAGPEIAVIQDFYSDRYAHHQAALICCRHVLEHLDNPRRFVQMLRRAIAGRRTAVFFEVPNGRCTLRDLAIWDIIYEHCSYFSSPSLAHLFRACAFEVCDRREAFEGQFLSLEAIPAHAPTGPRPDETGDLATLCREATAFAGRYRLEVMAWRATIDRLTGAGQRLVVWGAGSKGVSFLNTLGVRREVEYVVDVNPRKQGRYIAGTGQQIVAPDFLRDFAPDVVILMNPVYQREVVELARDLGLTPTLLCAGPFQP